MKKKELLKLIFNYTICFIIMFSFILFMFSYYDKSFLYDYDGLGQHIITLKSFRELLITLLKTGELTTYTFNIGLGMDFFANYAFYSFGDPLSYLSIFVPESGLITFYSIINVIRLYLVGLSFFAYTNYKKIKNSFGILCGALIYTFSTFNIAEFTLQPFFMNAVIMFPILMIGLDKCILENKKTFLIVTVLLMFVSHYYFAVLLNICGIIYGFILTICTYRKEGIKKVIKVLLRLFVCVLSGILLSSFILLPTASLFRDSGRSLGEVNYGYSFVHYQSMFLSLITNVNSNEGYLGTMIVGVIFFFYSIKHFNKYKVNIIFILTMFIIMLVPSLASKISLGSFPLLRFSFVIPFMIAFITSNILDSKINLKNIKLPLICLILYLVLTVLLIFITKTIYTFSYFDMSILFTSLILILIYLLIFYYKNKLDNICKKINLFELLTILLIIINSYVYTFYLYSSTANNYQSYFIEKDATEYLENNNFSQENFKEAIEFLKEEDKTFYRISFDEGLNNIGLYYDFNTISAYYSILPSYLDQLTYDMDSFKYQTNHMDNLDNRSKLLTLLNVKYYITDLEEVPFGFNLYKEIDNTKIYKNSNYLPYALFYDSYITKNEFDNYNSIEKEESMMSKVSLHEDDIDLDYVHYDSELSNIKKINHKIVSNNMYTLKGFEVKTHMDHLAMNVESDNNGEYYLIIENLKLSDPLGYTKMGYKELFKNSFTITVEANNNIKRKVVSDITKSPYVNSTKAFLLKLGSFDGYVGNISIYFDKLGTYTFDSLGIYCSEYKDVSKHTEKLSISNFEIEKVEGNRLEANVMSYLSGALVFSTTYSDNYEVYVDGEEVETYLMNNYFLGIYIDEGNHKVEIINKTPKKTLGMIVSLITLVILILNKKVFKIKM